MQHVAALLIGAALGAATIPHLPAPAHHDTVEDWVWNRFRFHDRLDSPLTRYRPPFAQKQLRFE
jgi:hypothetical protein